MPSYDAQILQKYTNMKNQFFIGECGWDSREIC